MSELKPVEVHLTLRDGGQSNQGAKFAGSEFAAAFPNAKDYGVPAIQTGGGTFMAEFVRQGRNPEETIKTIGDNFQGLEQTALYRSEFGLSTKRLPLDVHRYTLGLLQQGGIKTLQNFHGMNDPSMTGFLPPLAKEFGMKVLGTVCIQVNPDTMDNMDAVIEEHLDFIQQLLDQGHDGIYLKSANGVLDPKFTEKLVSRIRERFGPDLYIGMHAHNTYGLAVENYLAGIRAGVSSVDLLPDAYAEGTAQPGISVMMHAMEHSGDPAIVARMPKNINIEAIKADEAATYLFRGAYRGNEMEYNEKAIQNALDAGSAGGAIGVVKGMSMRQVLAKSLGTDDWNVIRDELYRMKANVVRKELGYPTNVTPYELMMDLQAAQCVVSVANGRAPMDMIHPMAMNYLVGDWGKVSKTVNPELQQRALKMRGLTEVVKLKPIEELGSGMDAASAVLKGHGVKYPKKSEAYVWATVGASWNDDDAAKQYITGSRARTLTSRSTPDLPGHLQAGKPLHDFAPTIFKIAYTALNAQKLESGFFKGVNEPELLATKYRQEIAEDLDSIREGLRAMGKSQHTVSRALLHANQTIQQVSSELGVKKDKVPQFELDYKFTTKNDLAAIFGLENVAAAVECILGDAKAELNEIFDSVARRINEAALLPLQKLAAVDHFNSLVKTEVAGKDHPSKPDRIPALEWNLSSKIENFIGVTENESTIFEPQVT